MVIEGVGRVTFARLAPRLSLIVPEAVGTLVTQRDHRTMPRERYTETRAVQRALGHLRPPAGHRSTLCSPGPVRLHSSQAYSSDSGVPGCCEVTQTLSCHMVTVRRVDVVVTETLLAAAAQRGQVAIETSGAGITAEA